MAIKYIICRRLSVESQIKELGGTMPEDLPTPEEDLKKLERRAKSTEKKMVNGGFSEKETHE